MESLLIGLLAETPIHPGIGRNLGVIDLPVAREAATDYPVLVASSLKGALKDHTAKEERDQLFGKQNEAGQLLVSDARLLLLPVRSLTGHYRWLSCPHILERLARDKRRAGHKPGFTVPKVEPLGVLASTSGPLFLEERELAVKGKVPDQIIDEVSRLIEPTCGASARVADQLVLLADEDFAWFARYGLAVQARNALYEEKKTSKNLWYEETLPPDTLMYALIGERREGAVHKLRAQFAARPYLQAGGNETIGQGIFLTHLLPEAS